MGAVEALAQDARPGRRDGRGFSGISDAAGKCHPPAVAGFAPVDPRVLAVMRPFLEAGIGNPSARHSLGAEARESLDAARLKVARLCGGAAGGIIFTSGATAYRVFRTTKR